MLVEKRIVHCWHQLYVVCVYGRALEERKRELEKVVIIFCEPHACVVLSLITYVYVILAQGPCLYSVWFQYQRTRMIPEGNPLSNDNNNNNNIIISISSNSNHNNRSNSDVVSVIVTVIVIVIVIVIIR